MKIIRANQVQNLFGSVAAAAVADIDVTIPPATIDGVTVATGKKFLLTGQTDKTENGIYVSDGSDLLRPVQDKNLAAGAENTLGASVFVVGGTAFTATTWFLSATDGGEGGYENSVAVIGTDEMEFSKSGVLAKELDFDSVDLVGDIDESNAAYALAAAYAAGTVLRVAVNGVVANEGIDFTVAAGTITMTDALQTGDTATALVLY